VTTSPSDTTEETTSGPLDQLAGELAEAVGGSAVVSFDTIKVTVSPDRWKESIKAIRDQFGMVFFSWLSAVHWANEVAVGDPLGEEVTERYELLCTISDLSEGRRVTISTDLDASKPRAASLVDVFAGADWRSGSMSTQLLFRPERLRVWTAKALAVTVGTGASALAVTVLFWLSLGLVARARELDVGGGLVQEIALQGGRAVVLAMGCALGGYALTMVLRSTTATLALLFGYTVAGEALWASVPVTKSSQWSLSANVRAWILDGAPITDDSICGPAGEACDPTYVLSAADGATYLGVLLAVALVLSLLTFPRRDVR
jgi:hypothetical protein